MRNNGQGSCVSLLVNPADDISEFVKIDGIETFTGGRTEPLYAISLQRKSRFSFHFDSI